jgi:hypothetical protein|tara:strand:- start:597 stop:1196 length:600 start_codon:yes stop_codon:yes gene_type:complete
MKKKIFITLLGLLIITGCATNNASFKKGSLLAQTTSGGCVEFERYGNSDLDNFLQSSYDDCNLLISSHEKIIEINDFVEDPAGWMATEVSKATSPYKQQLKSAAYIASNRDEAMRALKIAFVKEINVEILKELESAAERSSNTLSDSVNARKVALGLSGLKKLSGFKDIALAVNSYKKLSDLNLQLQAMASRLVGDLKI